MVQYIVNETLEGRRHVPSSKGNAQKLKQIKWSSNSSLGCIMSLYRDIVVGSDEVQFDENVLNLDDCYNVVHVGNIIRTRLCDELENPIVTTCPPNYSG